MQNEFSITTDLVSQRDLPGPLFAAFRAAGFSAVHWCQDWSGAPVFYGAAFAEQVRQLAEHNHLRVADVHGYDGCGTDVTYTDELFAAANVNRAEFAARVGASAVVLHLPARKCGSAAQRECAPPAEAVAGSTALLKMIRPAFEKLGVKAAVENLPWQVHDDRFVAELLEEFPPEFLGFCYDSGHAVMTRQERLLQRHAGRLLVTHLHDNDGTADQHKMPGEGKADWAAIMKTLRTCGYRGTINIEVSKPAKADLAEYCSQARQAIGRLWESAGA